jgi:hypothetical protein
LASLKKKRPALEVFKARAPFPQQVMEDETAHMRWFKDFAPTASQPELLHMLAAAVTAGV